MKKPRRGRPPKGDDQVLGKGIEVRFRAIDRTLIEAAAQLDDVALSAYVRDAAIEKAKKRIERKR